MKDFLNKLAENIILISSNDKIIFANNSFVNNMGYKENEVDLNVINSITKIKNNEIYIYYNNEILRTGICEWSKVKWFGEDVKAVVVVKWKNQNSDSYNIEILEKLLDQMDRWICIKNRDNQYVYVNQACADFYKTTKEKAQLILNSQLLDDTMTEYMVKEDDYVIESKNKCIYEVNKEIEDFKLWYEINKFPILDEKGEVQYIGSTLENITLDKNVQYKILDNLNMIDGYENDGNFKMNIVDESIFESFKKLFEKFLKTNNFNIWIYDISKKVIKSVFQPALFVEEMINEEYIPIEQAYIDKYFNGTYNKVFEITNEEVGGLGEKRSLYIVNYPIINQGEFKGIMTMSFNEYPTSEVVKNDFIKTLCSQIGFIIKYIELSKRIDEELRFRSELEEELEAFLEVSADYVVKVNATGTKEVSNGCFDVLGWTREEYLSMKPEDLIHPDDLSRTLELIKKQCETTEKLEWKNRLKCADGSYKWLSWRNRNFIDSKGYIFSSAKDITLEKELELKEKQIEKAKHLEEIRNEFFANISHEFKTPINMIMTTSQLMQQHLHTYDVNNNAKNEIVRYVNIFRQNGYRLLKLVNNLIDITKIDSGFYKIKPININIIEIIEDIVLSVVEYCEGNNVQLIFDTEVEEEFIACDPDQVERIILNLLSNAIKYTPKNGEIRVNIHLEEEYVVVKVKDTGIGIPKERLDLIFERFVQGGATLTRACEGSGIGLSLVKGLVQMHDGNISVSSEEGIGSTFEIRLPRKLKDSLSLNEQLQGEIKQSKVEKCSIEFADIYNL